VLTSGGRRPIRDARSTRALRTHPNEIAEALA